MEEQLYYEIEEEAERVVSDLINKVHNENNRNIKLPIKLNDIKDFCIHNTIQEQYTEKVILWIILRLSLICYINNS